MPWPSQASGEDEGDVVGGVELPTLPSAGGYGEEGPIGVPEDYTVDVPAESPVITRGEVPPSTQARGPRYYDGDEWEPARLTPDQVRAMQQAMWDAGLLEPGFRPGVWDQTMATAYRQVLAYANATGISDQQALTQMAAAGAVGTTQTEPLIIQRTNPEDLRRVFRSSIIGELGQGWDAERIDRMVAAYHAAEEQAQTQYYEMNQAGESGTFNAPPSPEAFAEAEARRQDPTGVGAHSLIADYVPLFMDLVNRTAA